jgi:hypothetical protein
MSIEPNVQEALYHFGLAVFAGAMGLLMCKEKIAALILLPVSTMATFAGCVAEWGLKETISGLWSGDIKFINYGRAAFRMPKVDGNASF